MSLVPSFSEGNNRSPIEILTGGLGLAGKYRYRSAHLDFT
jgi:hypothetical protein